MNQAPDRNMAFDLARVTEAAAIAAARWQGRGNKEAVDQAAVDGMRVVLSACDIDGTIVIGEGEKDHAPMLYNGERVGTGSGPAVDVAVDPVDGTTITSEGALGAISVIAISEQGTMYAPGSVVYMDKLAVGPLAAGLVDIEAPVEHNLKQVGQATGKEIDDLTVVMLNRPRNEPHIDACRAAGARVRLIRDGDVAAAIATAQEDTGIDIMLGIGGSPEAVIAACALTCMGGEIQAKLWPRDEAERAYAIQVGLDIGQVLSTSDLVASNNVFFAATGVTDSELLDGVRFFGDGARTHTLIMRSKTGTTRFMTSRHDLARLREIRGLID